MPIPWYFAPHRNRPAGSFRKGSAREGHDFSSAVTQKKRDRLQPPRKLSRAATAAGSTVEERRFSAASSPDYEQGSAPESPHRAYPTHVVIPNRASSPVRNLMFMGRRAQVESLKFNGASQHGHPDHAIHRSVSRLTLTCSTEDSSKVVWTCLQKTRVWGSLNMGFADKDRRAFGAGQRRARSTST